MKLRLTGKLVLMVTSISLLAVTVAGVAYRVVSGPAFQDLIVDQAAEGFVGLITLYYRENGKVDGIQSWLGPRVNEPPSPGSEGRQRTEPALARPGDPRPGGIVRFGLADAQGRVVLRGESDVQEGQTAPSDVLERGKPVMVDGNQVATILTPVNPVQQTGAQEAYARRITVALASAAIIGILFAVLASLLFARSLIHPLRRLMIASRDLADGKVGALVPARGHDEVAELTTTFNHMTADLARYDLARRQMAADIAHELRTPLTTISGYIEAMRDGDLAPTQERLDSVYYQTHRLSRVIDDLRLLAMADVGALPLERAPISVRELVVQSVRAHQVSANQRGVELRAEVDEDLPHVDADPGRIQQVIEILLTNALRHTEQGEVVVSAALDDEGAVIRVADTGSGIEPEMLPRLFDRFSRGEQARSKDSRGAGLGLAIARAIVNAHNGSIAVASQLATGTVFTVRLPLTSASPAL